MNMKMMMWVLMGVFFLSIPSAGAEIVTFDDLSLDPESFYNGSDGAGGFETTGVNFNNFFDDTYGPYWEGFAYSNTTDTTTPDYTNQYSAITGMGADASRIYGVAYVEGFTVSFPPSPLQMKSILPRPISPTPPTRFWPCWMEMRLPKNLAEAMVMTRTGIY